MEEFNRKGRKKLCKIQGKHMCHRVCPFYSGPKYREYESHYDQQEKIWT